MVADTMTYCVGVLSDDGLIFASDSRTHASLDLYVAHQQAATLDMPGYSFTEGVNEPVQRR